MIRLHLIIFLVAVTFNMKAQTNVYRDTISVYESGKVLQNPWAGGINFSSFSSIDLNLDGKNDIVAFDKISSSGFGKLKPFLNVGASNFKYAPQYESLMPKVQDWAMFYDYNNDGKSDLFAYTVGGIKVYKNTSTISTFGFVLVKSLLYSNYNPSGSPNIANIYSNSVGMPGIADIDGDGDLDIINFSVFGVRLEYHKNKSKELYGHADSLDFELADDCWGDIQETSCQVYLNQCPYPKMQNKNINEKSAKVLHAGSCIMCFDRDGDMDQELILGDISCTDVFYAENGGAQTNAHISDTTVLFPNYPVKSSLNKIQINSYPCTYYLDVDNDGYKDLLASPNAVSGSENFESVWYYKNTSTTPTVSFSFQKKNFLQDGMIELGEGAYPVLFDADSDGKKDLIIGNVGYYNGATNISKLAYYKNVGSTSSPSFSLITRDYQNLSTYNLFSMAPTFGDLDNDGDKDLIIGQNNGQLAYFKNTASFGGPALFVTAPVLNYKSIDVGNVAFPQIYDINKDGLLDLIIGSVAGTVSYYQNTGSASVPAFNLVTNFMGAINVKQYGSLTGYSTPYLFDNGGTTKMLVGSEIGNIYLYDNIDGNLTGNYNRVDTNLFKINDGARCAPIYEDINNDGKRDLFLGNYAGGLTFFNSINNGVVGLHEFGNKTIASVFPNPSHDNIQVSINTSEVENTIIIIDVLGQEIYHQKSDNNSISIDVSSFSKGLYFLSLQDKSLRNIFNSKIIIE
ncbi:MAG: T9SS type A sorting domain-containing protein [Bacteroidota bacterium]